jgi:two-component system, NarL family, sensor kinase
VSQSSQDLSSTVAADARLESVVLEHAAALQNFSQRLLKVQDEERRKLSRDLHDSTCQTLTALRIGVAMLEKKCDHDPSTRMLLVDLASLADQALAEIRTMSYLLHPPLLDEVGFACAAEWYLEGFGKRSGIKVVSEIENSGQRLPSRVEIVLFRVLQESLTNVQRHSGASDVSVGFKRLPTVLILEIRDFGKGISEERLRRLKQSSAEGGVGLAAMRERVLEINGKIEMQSGAYGTFVRATIPVEQP